MKRGGALESYAVSAVASGTGALVGAVLALTLVAFHLGVPALASLLMTPVLAAVLTWRSLEWRRLARALETGFVVYLFTYLLGFWLAENLGWWAVAAAPFAGAVVGAFARLLGTIARPGAPPRPFVPTSRRRAAIVGSVLLVMSTVYAGATILEVTSIRDMTRDIFVAPRPSADMIVCEKTMTAACAQEAADRAQVAVAWLPSASGFDFDYMLAPSREGSRKGFAFEHFAASGGEVAGDLVSGQGPLLGDAAGISQIVIDGRPVRMEIDRMPDGAPFSITLDWEVDGHPYTLSIVLTGLFSELDVDRAQITALYRQIRYAEPTSRASGGGS